MLRHDLVVLTEATGGLEAMDAAAARRFDLLLMDVSMSGMDGPEATHRIRARDWARGWGRTDDLAEVLSATRRGGA